MVLSCPHRTAARVQHAAKSPGVNGRVNRRERLCTVIALTSVTDAGMMSVVFFILKNSEEAVNRQPLTIKKKYAGST
jgi:hypothetical protein